MKKLTELFQSVVEYIATSIVIDFSISSHNAFKLVFEAYNRYCEDERDGRGYIFDINDKEHVKWLFSNECITLDEFRDIINGDKNLFLIDEEEGIVLLSKEEAKDKILFSIENVVKCMLLYAPRSGHDSEYTKLYEEYVTDELEGTEFTDYIAF